MSIRTAKLSVSTVFIDTPLVGTDGSESGRITMPFCHICLTTGLIQQAISTFFVVYTVEDSIEREVGKLVTTAGTVDDVIDEWTLRNHDS